jgi:probable rRNA maturation factor
MSTAISYEAGERLYLPYRVIIEKVVRGCLAAENFPGEAEVSVTLTGPEEIRVLNREYRGIDSETDVLSFPMLEFPAPADYSCLSPEDQNPETGETVLGDIVLNVAAVKRQAAEYGHTQTRELAFLTAHSMLHLLGYDHMEEEERLCMEERQRDILDQMGYRR